jgi:phage shock protein PspC (stress-responsive transcriptional regulator)
MATIPLVSRLQVGGETIPGHSAEIVVLHTGPETTNHALATANEMADWLRARIRLLVPKVVPYPLPLFEPPVSKEFTERQLRGIAAGLAVDIQIDVRVCRDLNVMLHSVLPKGTLVVLSGKRSILPTAEKRLARRLRRLGHRVVFSEIE